MERDNSVKTVPVVFAVDDNYLKYASIAIASVLDKRKANEKYLFYIIHRNVTEEHQKMLQEWLNMRFAYLEFINISEYLGGINRDLLYISGYITEETYYRILIPQLLPQWDIVIYMDCDIICLGNLGEILEEANFIDDSIWLAGTLASRNETRDEYCKSYLGILSDGYIFAGMLVMNCAALRRQGFARMCFEFLEQKKALRQHDMDLINKVCYGHIQILEQNWHTTLGAISYKLNKSVEKLTAPDLQCRMLHYATNKPWNSELTEVMLPFWKYVWDSPFVSEIGGGYRAVSDTLAHFLKMCENGQVSIWTLLHICFVVLMQRMRAVYTLFKKNYHCKKNPQ